MIISTIKINLTLYTEVKLLDKDSFSHFDQYIDSLGIVLVEVENASVKLKGFQMKQKFKSLPVVQELMFEEYKNNLMKQLFQIIGSVEVLGNPIQLYNNVGEGIMDFYEKPIEGFIQGPLEGGKGLIKGTASLVGKTLSGVTNTLSKITGSVAGGISKLTFDDKYIKKRK